MHVYTYTSIHLMEYTKRYASNRAYSLRCQRSLYTLRTAGAKTSSFSVLCVLCACCDSDISFLRPSVSSVLSVILTINMSEVASLAPTYERFLI